MSNQWQKIRINNWSEKANWLFLSSFFVQLLTFCCNSLYSSYYVWSKNSFNVARPFFFFFLPEKPPKNSSSMEKLTQFFSFYLFFSLILLQIKNGCSPRNCQFPIRSSVHSMSSIFTFFSFSVNVNTGRKPIAGNTNTTLLFSLLLSYMPQKFVYYKKRHSTLTLIFP